MEENYPVLVSVTATLPKEHASGKDEKPEDKAKLDQEFQAQQMKLADKLSKERRLAGRPYLISKATIDQLLKNRNALIAEKKATPSPTPKTPTANAKGVSPVPSPSPRRRPK